MDTFTCISCRVAFKDGDIQRLHYKSDWHRYNLKRKVAELPPVTAEEFRLRVLAQRSEAEASVEDKSVRCEECGKVFGTRNAYENHLNSKKHKEMVKNFGEKLRRSEEGEIEEVVDDDDDDEWDDYNSNDVNDCLFCSHHSKNLLNNVKHMTRAHTFFIPDVEYCIDITGLLMYLDEKINSGFMCIWCNDKGRTFHSSEAAKQHMLDKGHCRMLHEGDALAEYSDFYDYSSSYPDHNNDDENPNTEVEAVPELLEDSDYQLVLPSGAVIGHRSLARYYRQNIDPNRAVVLAKNQKKLHKVLATYRALGWSETEQQLAARRARDLHHMKRIVSKYNMQLGCKGNKLQKHFRAQVNF